jgi:hypothetical protein
MLQQTDAVRWSYYWLVNTPSVAPSALSVLQPQPARRPAQATEPRTAAATAPLPPAAAGASRRPTRARQGSGTAQSARPTARRRENAPFLELSLCLSRACPGKMIIFRIKSGGKDRSLTSSAMSSKTSPARAASSALRLLPSGPCHQTRNQSVSLLSL